jgi:hypothetical protein
MAETPMDKHKEDLAITQKKGKKMVLPHFR